MKVFLTLQKMCVRNNVAANLLRHPFSYHGAPLVGQRHAKDCCERTKPLHFQEMKTCGAPHTLEQTPWLDLGSEPLGGYSYDRSHSSRHGEAATMTPVRCCS